MPLTTTIGSVMTGYPYSVETDAHLSTAKSMFTQYNIHHLPVRNGDKWVGVITARDLRIAEDLGVDISVKSDVRVRNLCNRTAYIVGPDEPLVTVLQHMAEWYLDAVLVVRSDKLLGIFTSTDTCKRYAGLLSGK